MVENKIYIDDLYGAMLSHIGQLRSDDGCHYTSAGSNFFAERVVNSIKNLSAVKKNDS